MRTLSCLRSSLSTATTRDRVGTYWLYLSTTGSAGTTSNGSAARARCCSGAGRTTVSQLWPPIADDDSADPVEREISRRNNAIEKIVVSDTLRPEETAPPWTETTRILARAAALQEVAELKHGSGGDILVFGSATMWNELLQAGLVDELHVMVGPALLGSGTPAYVAPKRMPLQLIDARVLDDSQLVLVRYDARACAQGLSPPADVSTPSRGDIGTLAPASGGSAGRGSTSGAEWR